MNILNIIGYYVIYYVKYAKLINMYKKHFY